ncbi:MAG: hypothetical protein QOH97_217 [Actinoplanes sp.]|jgi:UPF0755 protein|nr:hypothetical protein [Actinoplanes sp.]
MIDELDLAFGESVEKGKPRHRRGSRGKSGKGGKSAVAFLMAFILLAVLGGGVYFGYNKVKGFFTAADYSGPGLDPVQVQVKDNDTLTDMGNALVDSDVVKSTAAFVDAANANPQGKNIRPGTYQLRKQMAAKQAVTLLLDPKARLTSGVTVPEGKTALQTFDILSKATNIPVADFKAAAKDPSALGVPGFWFKRFDKKKAAVSIEGFLFPDTYEFDPKATAEDDLKEMVQHFLKVAEEIGFVDTVQQKLSVSPFEALTVASLAQAEAGIPADLPGIARVAYNRVYKAHMALQFDVTANYWLELNGKAAKHSGKLLQSELNDLKNPYNTESKLGLPAGPINSPGEAALKGAENPPAKDWLYFVAIDKSGKSAFASTNAEHDKNVHIACKNGIPLC